MKFAPTLWTKVNDSKRVIQNIFIFVLNDMAYNREDVARSLLRIGLGLIFFWAFIDKLFGLGFATKAEKSWLGGASPTEGFLSKAAYGPFADIFHAMAGSAVVDWLFMLGLLGIGLALILGIGMRIATISGSVMLFLMWLALLPPKNHPFLDDHIIYIIALCVLYPNPGSLGLSRRWKETGLVRKYGWLA